MRALSLIPISALIVLWSYFLAAVHGGGDLSTPSILPVEKRPGEVSAFTLNNEGVRLARQGRNADALAYLERAREFRPRDERIAGNVRWQRARVEREAWLRVLVPASAAVALLLLLAGSWHAVRAGLDGSRLARLRLRGHPRIRVRPRDERARLDLRFTEPVRRLLRRHPLTIVWSCAAHGKHMKSRPPVEARGRSIRVDLEGERLERLRRFPGEWRGFLYVGKTQVGEAGARVG